MSFPVAPDLKERVREATDIVALLGSYLTLAPHGRGYVATCPFHDDTNPSLRINPERQSWKCWPCDKGGDVFSFVMLRENVSFPEALKILADRAGIEYQQRGPVGVSGSPNDKATLYKAMAWAETQYFHYLKEGSDAGIAQEYLAKRQIDAESIERYRIGFSPMRWQWMIDRAREAGYSSEMLEALGLVVRKENGHFYDRFAGRVIFPIRDVQNRPIGVGGRVLPQFAKKNPKTKKEPAKYLNCPETRIYSKSDQLYGLNTIRETLDDDRRAGRPRNVLVMEGYTDVVMSRQLGARTPVAACGTALGARHIRLLKRFADCVTLVLDGDEAGQKRTGEVLKNFLAGQIELRIVTLPHGLDPCDFMLQRGLEEFEKLVSQAPDALEYCVSRETRGIHLASNTQQADQSLQRILQTMAAAPRVQEDTATAQRLREQQTLSRLARMFHVDEPLLRQQLGSLRERQPRRRQDAVHVPPQDAGEAMQRPHGWERELFVHLIQFPEAVAVVVEKIAVSDMRTDTGRTLLTTYQGLEAEGKIPGFLQVMDATTEDTLKNYLVELAEAADRTQSDDPDAQLNELLRAFTHRRETLARRKQVAEIESGSLKDEEEIELLNRLLESKRLEP